MAEKSTGNCRLCREKPGKIAMKERAAGNV